MTPDTGTLQFRNSWVGPNWLAKPWSARFLYSCLKILDQLMEVLYQGVAAPFPGFGTPTALPYIGQSRGLTQGEGESDAKYAARLIKWLDTWANAGSDEVLAQSIQEYLGNTPTVRIVNRAGFWVTANPDGTISYQTDTAWNWDGVSNPERAGNWSDLWIVVTPAEWTVYPAISDTSWRSAWGNANGFGLGHEVTRATVDTVRALVRQWKGPHTNIVAIIWVFPANANPPLFVPGHLGGAGNPDGRWGSWSYNVNGTQVPIRTTAPAISSGGGSVRYWTP
jgi:hypothetical protein